MRLKDWRQQILKYSNTDTDKNSNTNTNQIQIQMQILFSHISDANDDMGGTPVRLKDWRQQS